MRSLQNPFDLFDGIICINLDHRTDRWDLIQEQFNALGVLNKVIRLSAVQSYNGELGKARSHVKAVQIAQKKGWKNVLVFEDDAHLYRINIESLRSAFNNLDNDWSVMYLGGQLWTQPSVRCKGIMNITHNYTTHAIAYNKKVYKRIIAKYGHKTYIFNKTDLYRNWLVKNIQIAGQAIMPTDVMFIESASYSNTTNSIHDTTLLSIHSDEQMIQHLSYKTQR